MKIITDYIAVSERVMDDEELQLILDFCTAATAWRPSRVGTRGTVDTSTRNCSSLIGGRSEFGIPESVWAPIDKVLLNAFSRAVSQYIIKHPDLFVETDTGYELLRYEVGGFYSWHTDHFEQHPRSLSALLFLNDDFTGGELEFDDLTIKPQRGHVALFPSNFMFRHRVTPVEAGTRYTCVTWFK